MQHIDATLLLITIVWMVLKYTSTTPYLHVHCILTSLTQDNTATRYMAKSTSNIKKVWCQFAGHIDSTLQIISLTL